MYEKLTQAELAAKAQEAMDTLNKLKQEQQNRADKAKARFNKVIDKIKSLIVESGVKGRLTFDVPEGNGDITWKIGKNKTGTAKKGTKKNGHHLTKALKEKLDEVLSAKKIPAMTSKDGNVKIGDLQVTATQLAEYAILAVGPSSSEVVKMFPVLSIGQANGVTLRWKNGIGSKVTAEVSQ